MPARPPAQSKTLGAGLMATSRPMPVPVKIPLLLIPMTLAEANEFVRQRHRHHKPVPGCKFCIGVARNLERLIQASSFQGEDFPVFCSSAGTPIDQHNVSTRVFSPLALKLGFPITWHAWRRAHSSFAGQVEGVSVDDRVKTMGHADASSTLYYSIDDIERRRKIPEEIRARLARELSRMKPASEVTQ